jgi:hypothetical protein
MDWFFLISQVSKYLWMYYDILGISNYGYNQYINGLVESGKNTGKSQIFHGKIPMVSG